jgi:hypothetical protein
MKSTSNVLTAIAREHFGIETLQTRNRDSLDVYDVCVWDVKKALRAAYQAGARSSAGSASPASKCGTIQIEVRGGSVQDVSNVPPGWDHQIIDHDNAE